MQEIKFCQFCRNNELDIEVTLGCESGKKYRVHCRQCGANGPLRNDKDNAILWWNNRINEVPEIPNETLEIIKPAARVNMECPIRNGVCKGANCMMWIWVGNDKGRCGLVNTIYETTGCMLV